MFNVDVFLNTLIINIHPYVTLTSVSTLAVNHQFAENKFVFALFFRSLISDRYL